MTGIFLFMCLLCKSSDTILVDFVHLDQSIKSIANDSTGKIWISGGLGLQYWDGEKFVVEEKEYEDFIFSKEPLKTGPKLTPKFHIGYKMSFMTW